MHLTGGFTITDGYGVLFATFDLQNIWSFAVVAYAHLWLLVACWYYTSFSSAFLHTNLK